MLYQYDSEFDYWGPDKREGMYVGYPDSIEKMMEQYNEQLAYLEKLLQKEPPRKHSADSKFKYKSWISLTHEYRDELNRLAEAIRAKQCELQQAGEASNV